MTPDTLLIPAGRGMGSMCNHAEVRKLNGGHWYDSYPRTCLDVPSTLKFKCAPADVHKYTDIGNTKCHGDTLEMWLQAHHVYEVDVDSQLVPGRHYVTFRARRPAAWLRVPERPNRDGSWREAWVVLDIVCSMSISHQHFSQDPLEYTQGRAVAAAAAHLIGNVNMYRQSYDWLCTRTEVPRP